MKKNSIYNFDCLDLMKLINDSYFDLIIADPPYYKICGEFDYEWYTVEEYIGWCQKWLLECKRVLKPNGSFYLWGKIGYNNGYALPRVAAWIERNNHFRVINWITQRNTRGRGNKKGFIEAREELIFMVKTINNNYTWNKAYRKEKSNKKDLGFNGKPRKNKYKRCTDVWIDFSEASQSSKQRFKTKKGKSFPTVKSLNLCDRIIKASSNENDLVFIPFAGSGSEIISCIKNKRNFIATETNKIYYEEILLPRINKYQKS